MSFEINNVPLWQPAKRVKRRATSTYPLKLVHSDYFIGSRKAIGEDNDCTVIALAIAAELPYDVAHELLAVRCGRQPKKGSSFMRLIGATGIIGEYKVSWHHLKVTHDWNQYRPRAKGTTVKQLVESGTLPRRCVLAISSHVMACIDSVVHDHSNMGARSVVNGYYSFERVWQ